MTNGIHPKVALPALALAAIGAVLLIVGVVAGDNTARDVGLAAIGASGITGGVGFAAPAAGVTVNATANDEQLANAGVLGHQPEPPAGA